MSYSMRTERKDTVLHLCILWSALVHCGVPQPECLWYRLQSTEGGTNLEVYILGKTISV